MSVSRKLGDADISAFDRFTLYHHHSHRDVFKGVGEGKNALGVQDFPLTQDTFYGILYACMWGIFVACNCTVASALRYLL